MAETTVNSTVTNNETNSSCFEDEALGELRNFMLNSMMKMCSDMAKKGSSRVDCTYKEQYVFDYEENKEESKETSKEDKGNKEEENKGNKENKEASKNKEENKELSKNGEEASKNKKV